MRTTAALVAELTEAERRHIASWAVKTSRTEEWTGQQVMRLVALARDGRLEVPEAALLQQAAEELEHARLYAGFARQIQPAAWCEAYCAERGNFAAAPFTAILRRLDATPVLHGGPSLVRFFTGLFFLDLAGLMTVNVYDESPFGELQEIALTIRSDEGRHVQLGREYLLAATRTPDGRALLEDAVKTFLPEIDAFFGGDDSPVQATLQRVGIRKTTNAALKAKFRTKVAALLHLD